MSGDEYANLGLGLGEGKGLALPMNDGENPGGAIGGVPPMLGVGVPTRANCHGAGEALRTIV